MTVKHLKDEDHFLEEGSGWFSVKDFSIRIAATDEGVVVDIFKEGQENRGAVAATYAFDADVNEEIYQHG